MNKYIFPIALLLAFNTMAQEKFQPLQVGDTIPEIVIEKIRNYSSGPSSMPDLKNKLLILDFWNIYCSSCIASFPKMEKLQSQFSDKIRIILVNNSDDKNQIDQLFQRKGWIFPKLLSVTNVPQLSQLFPNIAFPHHVWIGSNGTVLAITDDKYASKENIEIALSANKLDLHEKYEQEFDTKLPLMTMRTGIRGDLPLYYSAVTKRIMNQTAGNTFWRGSKLIYNQSIAQLYITAFDFHYISGFNRLIFDVSDSLREMITGPQMGDSLQSINAYYEWQEENTYCYNLYFNLESGQKEKLNINTKNIMKKDLNIFFGFYIGIMADIEIREVKCLSISRKTMEFNEDRTVQDDVSFSMNNEPVAKLVRELELCGLNTPIVSNLDKNETWSIKLNGDLSNLDNVRDQLSKYGLKLVEEMKPLEMIVFREVKSNL